MYKIIQCNLNSYKILWYTTLTSTNTKATEMALQNAPEGTVIACDFQTEGRGQRNTNWESEKGKNLTFSLILRPEFLTVDKQFTLLQTISLGVCDYLSQIGIDARIKWPNDIYVDDYKITGMLIEHSIMGEHLAFSVIGIGLNLNQESFISNATNPISAFQKTGKYFNLVEALNNLLICIDKRYTMLKNHESSVIYNDYFKLLYHSEGWHWYEANGRVFKAQIAGISPIGELILNDENNTLHQFAFKEVRFILPS